MTKLTIEQISHYLKGGMFKATYNPPHLDIGDNNKLVIGTTITVHQNMINSPLQTPIEYKDQHAFNSDSIGGWFPEEDIENIIILDDFIENVQVLPAYIYRLHYTKESQIEPNFGKNTGIKLPFVTSREYIREMDDYILKLSTPQATIIEKAIYTGLVENLTWIKIL